MKSASITEELTSHNGRGGEEEPTSQLSSVLMKLQESSKKKEKYIMIHLHVKGGREGRL